MESGHIVTRAARQNPNFERVRSGHRPGVLDRIRGWARHLAA
jgi:hypothetical protein